jgi:integrase
VFTHRKVREKQDPIGLSSLFFERIGLKGLSAHDCRHYWASQAARNQTPLPEQQDAGGWNSVAMPMRYIEKSQVASVRRKKE